MTGCAFSRRTVTGFCFSVTGITNFVCSASQKAEAGSEAEVPSSVTIHRAKPLKSLNPVLCGMGYSTPFTSATSNCVAIRFTKSARSTPSQ